MLDYVLNSIYLIIRPLAKQQVKCKYCLFKKNYF
uniref:Uncharacterized protein n=1 Tax=Anguilla anguilla TaxID=7936 RepID=A0A0E9PUJ8_ANGAN